MRPTDRCSTLSRSLACSGMETDLALVRRVRRTALITSAAGIVIPFACGYVLGEMLPDRLASRLAGWLVGARHLTATVMDAGSAANGSGPTSSASQGIIEAAETAAHAVEAKEKPHATETKNKARDPIDAAAKGAKAERIPVRKLISILLLEAHDVKTDDACAEAILAEAKNGYGLLFLGLGAGSMATTHTFPPAIEKIVREFVGPIAIALHCGVRDASSEARLEKILVPMTGVDYSRFGAEVAVAIAKGGCFRPRPKGRRRFSDSEVALAVLGADQQLSRF